MGLVGTGGLGVCMSCRKACLILLVVIFSTAALAQVSHSEQVQIAPPLVRAVDPPAQDATAADLEQQGDRLRAAKLYLDALDYYHAALGKKPNDARLLNKIGITNLMMQRYKDARKAFEHAIRADREYADAYNNLGVVFYEAKKYGAAVKQYEKAIAKDSSSASFFSNLGAAHFSKREFEPAVAAYQHALELDPEVFERTSRAGVQAQLPSPDDRARYDYSRKVVRQDGLVGAVARVFAEGDRGRLQGFEERVQRRGVCRVAEESALHGTDGGEDAGDLGLIIRLSLRIVSWR